MKQERPVMIHRTILGSAECIFSILLEHCKGKWPFWLSPQQAIVCPFQTSQPYALQVREEIHQAGYEVDVDTTGRKIEEKKVREAQLAQYNYTFVVGDMEANTRQVCVHVKR